MELTQQYLKSILNYDKDTGIFTWRVSRNNRIKAGDLAGTLTSKGYIQVGIKIDGIALLYGAHRLAWLYEYGKFPSKDIDHINHDRLDNRICNLREADQKINQKNRTINKNNKSGFTGVSWHKNRNRWQATICVNKTIIHLGSFKDKNEAIMARLHANRLYKFHENHGK
ncbi:HNH endonuclease [bacterium]|nr:HNH endonuclease [bacterium]